MKVFRFLIFFCLPAFLFAPLPAFPYEAHVFKDQAGKELYVPRDVSGKFNPWELYKIENFTYDRIFEFAELLELDEFWESLSQEEFDVLIDYLIWAMRFSTPKNRPDLQQKAEEEVECLLSIVNSTDDEPLFLLNQDLSFEMLPAVCYGYPHFIQCGWLSKQFKKVKNWVKENKGAIIVCAVVATAIVVGAATGGVGASSAVAVGGALAGGAMDDAPPPSDHINKPGEVLIQEPLSNPPLPSLATPPTTVLPNTPPPQPTILPHAEDVYTAINQTADLIKEELSIDISNEPQAPTEQTFWEEIKEGARETASYFAHEILEGVSKINEYLYELGPVSSIEEYADYQELTQTRHETIDQVFGTDQTKNYPAEAVTHDPNMEMQIGVLPPSGSMVGAAGRAVTAARTGAATGAATVGSTLTQTNAPASNIDPRLPNNPDELLKDPNWQEVSHPEAAENGHRTFENTETGETLRYDEGTPGKSGHRGEPHWHRENPNSIGKHDEYLDANGNPVPRGSEESHLYPAE